MYKREAARLRAEEQADIRENEAYQKEMRKLQILEKHLNMQQKLDCKYLIDYCLTLIFMMLDKK